ncbi:phage tail protein [Pseudomonas sp. EMN2]|uniref:phage tail protein n=1 Tax=Pseudomonas sp. EMN2 TaxID=2615212 RepID=UPI00129BD9B4|nr:phage tail protein [Pseudomonas sp. EMN2]
MNKPDSLRAHLLQAVPDLQEDRLLMFIDEGKVRCTGAESLSFEYGYNLQIILTDYAGHPDAVMVPLLGWLKVHQSELLHNLDKSKEGVKFEADILDRTKVDLSITLPLTERVIVGTDGQGGTTIQHAGEPQPAEWSSMEEWVVQNG